MAISVLCSCVSIAQEPVTLNEAIRTALERHPELRRRTAEIRKAEALLDESARLPNPVFAYSREELNLQGTMIGEWTAVGSIPVNFLWDRWDNISSRRKALEAERMMLEQAKQDIMFQVGDTFVRATGFTALAAELDTALVMLDGVAAAARQRMQDGDISQYEYQRVIVEVRKLRSEVGETALQRDSYLTQLRLATGLDSTVLRRVSPMTDAAPAFPPPETGFQTALEKRWDLKALDLLLGSANDQLAHSRLKVIPTIHVGGGYKRQFDRYAGAVLQMSLEIPLFRRNQAETEMVEAGIGALTAEREFLRKQVAADVHEAYARLRQYERLIADRDDLQLHTIVATAELSYRQGESSLVEFIDGLKAFTEGMQLRTDFEVKYRTSGFALARALGIPWTDEQTAR